MQRTTWFKNNWKKNRFWGKLNNWLIDLLNCHFLLANFIQKKILSSCPKLNKNNLALLVICPYFGVKAKLQKDKTKFCKNYYYYFLGPKEPKIKVSRSGWAPFRKLDPLYQGLIKAAIDVSPPPPKKKNLAEALRSEWHVRLLEEISIMEEGRKVPSFN